MKQQDFIRDTEAMGDSGIVVANAKKRRLDLFARLVCLVIAFICWIYFINMNDDDFTAEIKVNLEVVGKEALRSETGQMVYGLDTQEVTIVVKGTNRDIKKYSATDYKVVVDVSTITGSGKHLLEVTPQIPEDTGLKLSVESISPQNVVIYSDVVVTEDIPFEAVNAGIKVNDAYNLGEIIQSSSNVSITGPKAIVDTIEKAQFRISSPEYFYTSTTYSGFKLDLYDRNGENVPYDSSIITYSTSDIKVTVPIYTVNALPISVLWNGEAIDTDKYIVTVTPVDGIKIVGDPTSVSAMKNIEINLNDEQMASGTVNWPVWDIPIVSGLTFAEDAPTYIEITIQEKE